MKTKSKTITRNLTMPRKKGVKSLSLRAKKAVDYLVVHGSSKKEALRKAKYSEAIATVPSKIFDSEPVKNYMAELQKDLPLHLAHEAVKRSIKKTQIKRMYFDDEIEDEVITQIFIDADTPLLKIIRKEKSGEKDVFHKIVYYKDENYDSQLRASEQIYKVHKLIGARDTPGFEEGVAAGAFMGLLRDIYEKRNGATPIEVKNETKN